MVGLFAQICGAPVSKGEHLSRILAERGYDRSRCLFLGDATADCRAAKDNDVPFLAILPGPDAPLLAKYPDVTWFTDFHALTASGLVNLPPRNRA